jgi:hypothetical protein
MLSGKLAKAERGELAVPLPIGYVRRPSGEAVLDPDEQAQHVVRLVFGAFRRLGTLNGVLRYLVGQEIQLPVRVHSGPSKGELEWRRPTRETLQIMLHNPVYAGYYAYGRRPPSCWTPRREAASYRRRTANGRVLTLRGLRVVRGAHRPDVAAGGGGRRPELVEVSARRSARWRSRRTADRRGVTERSCVDYSSCDHTLSRVSTRQGHPERHRQEFLCSRSPKVEPPRSVVPAALSRS